MAELFTSPASFFFYAILQATIFLLIIRFLDVYEREPIWVVALMGVWGGGIAIPLALFGNEFVSGMLSEELDTVLGAALTAPLVEEIAKGIALVLAFLASRWAFKKWGRMEFDGVMDGIVYGAAVGFGFSVVEDILYFFNFTASSGSLQQGLDVFLMRVDLLGFDSFGHSVYTGFFGAGLGMATWSATQRARLMWPALGLLAGIGMHFLHNGLNGLLFISRFGLDQSAAAFQGAQLPVETIERMNATSEFAEKAVGWLDTLWVVLFFALIYIWQRYQKKIITFELAEEANSGFISPDEWAIVPSFVDRTKWYAQLAMAGKFGKLHDVSAAHRELAELAFAKWKVRQGASDLASVDVHRKRLVEMRRRQLAAEGLPLTT